jgi:hypothetical protein
MNIYHFIVIGIIAVAIGIPAYRFPHLGLLFRLGIALLIAAALTALLLLTLYLYFAATGEA